LLAAHYTLRDHVCSRNKGNTVAIGKSLIALGIVLVLVGLIITYAPWLINWFGKLPGDIRIEDQHRFVFIPLTSMLVISIILTLLVNLFFRK
jgi:H+/Cl- antiporter ClcA